MADCQSRFIELFGDPVANPHGFDKVALSELADIKIGPFGSLLHKEDYIEGGHALLNPSHIIDGKVAPDYKLTVSAQKYEELSAYHLKADDVVMGRRGEMGRCAVVPCDGYLCGTGSLMIRTKGEVTADYIQKIISFPSFKKTIEDSLMQFLVEVGPVKNPIITHLTDPIIGEQEGIQLDAAYDFEDYRAKVNRYVNEHGNTLAIYKLTHNIPLSHGDYQELERVLTSELGSKEDYEREFGDTPFGLLIRKIAKLDHDAAMEAFSQFINDQSLNQKQIAFLHKIINHIEQNGYMESVTMLTKPPFDKPLSFTRLFDKKMQIAIMAAINKVKDNAVVIAA